MNKTYIKNTAILFVSMAITKIVGALFKIPLANILGGVGMGYFAGAYGLYSPVFALTAAGIPTVMMRITACNISAGRTANALAVRKTAMLLFSAIGFAGSAFIFFFAEPFARYVSCSPESALAVKAIAPAILFCSMASVIRGYHEGRSDIMPSSEAALAEAVSRAVFGLAMSFGVIFYARYRFENGGIVFGVEADSYEQAHNIALPYAAAAAILAVSISELVGLITAVFADKRRSQSADRDFLPIDSRRHTAKRLFTDILPIACSALVMNFVSFIDLVTVTRTLNATALANAEFFERTYADAIASCGGLDALANFVYGSYSGIAMSLFMMIPSFAGMSEKTSLPDISAAWEQKDFDKLSENISTMLNTTSLIGFPACFGALALAEPILTMLYPSRAAEVSVCVMPFIILCTGGGFLFIGTAFFGILQAIGKAYYPLILMSVSILIKLILNPLLISVPQLSITGAALSTVIGYIVMCVGAYVVLRKNIGRKIGLLKAAGVPMTAAAICAITAFLTEKNLSSSMNQPFSTITAVLAGGFVYVILLIFNKLFRIIAIRNNQKQKKFAKPLEK